MKKFYVTKKQVNSFIDSKLSLFNGSLGAMLEVVESTLVYLDSNVSNTFDEAQIKFYSRVKARLVYLIEEESSAKNKQC